MQGRANRIYKIVASLKCLSFKFKQKYVGRKADKLSQSEVLFKSKLNDI